LGISSKKTYFVEKGGTVKYCQASIALDRDEISNLGKRKKRNPIRGEKGIPSLWTEFREDRHGKEKAQVLRFLGCTNQKKKGEGESTYSMWGREKIMSPGGLCCPMGKQTRRRPFTGTSRKGEKA